MSFVHLHNHSEYSLLDGLSKLPDMLKRVKELGQPALALTDHGAMYGIAHFYNKARALGIKPILGLEAYMSKTSRFDKQARPGSDQFHITLLAQNTAGYKNLMKLTSIAHIEGFSYKPRIDEEVLFAHAEGVIATTGCMGSLFNQLILNGEVDQAITKIREYATVFSNRFYIEIQHHPDVPEVQELTTQLVAISRQLGIPLVATNDNHYVHQDDAAAQDALLCVQTRKLVSDEKRMKMTGTDYFIKSTEEMQRAFAQYPDAIENTVKIADMCDVEIPQGNVIFPIYDIPEGETTETFIRSLAFTKLDLLYPGVKEHMLTAEGKPWAEMVDETDMLLKIAKRLNYEIQVIGDKGYLTYFLIVQDFVNWAKNTGIFVGPGRGSAAGSLLSYALNITSIDPIVHDLPFERFMNPERASTPDIDIDFADVRREEVIQYVTQKYGEDKVAQIITFGRMESKAAIRDIGRVLGFTFAETDHIAKLIPDPVQGHTVHISEALAQVSELKQYYDTQPRYKQLIDLAMKVESNARHTSVHAAGVIISDLPLTEYAPIQKDTKTGKITTQYDMKILDLNVSPDAIGLLKMDFLGLRNLSILEEAIRIIKQTKNTTINLEKIPLDDHKVYDMISAGNTTGVFQMESGGMRKLARGLKPSVFSDLTAMVALYRPGPMDLIDDFIAGKTAPDSIQYPHQDLIPVLKDTYGILLYQEQCLLAANVMAGYSMGQADELRRAIGKKKLEIMMQEKEKFTKGALKLGYDHKTIDKVWGFIEKFAGYGFGKAHSASYAMIAYQTAWMKANYPVEYMCAMLSIESTSGGANREQKVEQGIQDCREMGILVLPPDINASQASFSIQAFEGSHSGLAIRFGLAAIKNVGTAAIDHIVEQRQTGGAFHSFSEFLMRTEGRKVNKKVLESLIKVGAFDQFATRASMLEQLEDIRAKATQFQSDVDGQDSLFGDLHDTTATKISDTFPRLEEYPKQELLSFEKELLGLYLTDHPMGKALKNVAERANKSIGEIDATIHKDQTFLIGGYLSDVRQVVTKKRQEKMCFGTITDQTGSMRFVIFPKLYKDYERHLINDAVILLRAKVDVREEEVQLVGESVTIPEETMLDAVPSDMRHEIFIPRKTAKETLQQIGALLKASPGDHQVILLIPNGADPKKIILPYTVHWTKEIEDRIHQLLQE